MKNQLKKMSRIERTLIGTSLDDDPTFEPWRILWQNSGVKQEQIDMALLQPHEESCLYMADLLLEGDYTQDPMKRDKQFNAVIHISACPEVLCQVGNRFFESTDDGDEISFKADISRWKQAIAESQERVE